MKGDNSAERPRRIAFENTPDDSVVGEHDLLVLFKEEIEVQRLGE